MAGLAGPSAAANVWPRMQGALPPTSTSFPPLNSPANPGNFPPPIPQAPTTPFPPLGPSFGATNNYNPPANPQGYNPNAAAAVK